MGLMLQTSDQLVPPNGILSGVGTGQTRRAFSRSTQSLETRIVLWTGLAATLLGSAAVHGRDLLTPAEVSDVDLLGAAWFVVVGTGHVHLHLIHIGGYLCICLYRIGIVPFTVLLRSLSGLCNGYGVSGLSICEDFTDQ